MAAMRGAAGAGVALALLLALVALSLQGCGDGTETLSEEETKELLRQLPYRFEFSPVTAPDGADGAVGGTVFGPHRTYIRFGISLGEGAEKVSLGPDTDFSNGGGTETAHLTADDTRVVDGKLRINPRFKTRAQWETAATIHVAIEEKLCKATEGHPCPI
jgi:hypothetical protein